MKTPSQSFNNQLVWVNSKASIQRKKIFKKCRSFRWKKVGTAKAQINQNINEKRKYQKERTPTFLLISMAFLLWRVCLSHIHILFILFLIDYRHPCFTHMLYWQYYCYPGQGARTELLKYTSNQQLFIFLQISIGKFLIRFFLTLIQQIERTSKALLLMHRSFKIRWKVSIPNSK